MIGYLQILQYLMIILQTDDLHQWPERSVVWVNLIQIHRDKFFFQIFILIYTT